MATVQIFVRDNNMATIICPVCNASRRVSVAAYLKGKHFVKTRCTKCNEVFTIMLDFRGHFRKPTNLSGTYSIINPKGMGGGVMQIQNISRSGIGFTVSGKHNMEENQTLSLEFQLNDKKQTPLKKQVVIKSVQKNYIGCQFAKNEDIEKALGFYLQF
ncbi:MAG: hypothetical protein GQ559_12090 [Desulfobulbaceae bacterium]|nr:hypothetical protein [Desulfobulbaceae bacterium]